MRVSVAAGWLSGGLAVWALADDPGPPLLSLFHVNAPFVAPVPAPCVLAGNGAREPSCLLRTGPSAPL